MGRPDKSTPLLALGALGVVFGDIGTSPLYALRTILGEGSDLSRDTVYGLTSMAIWSLVIVVMVLYLGLLMGTDNEGQGGLLALVGLVRRARPGARTLAAVSILGMIGASMFLGDSVITPAISVLSAAEGLETASPSLHRIVLPVAMVILAGVFVLQRAGTGTIGKLYGPVMVVWFATLAVTGAVSVGRDPGVLTVLSPTWAARFVVDEPATAFIALGSVVLAVTGAEALYTDLGHFGRRPIVLGWLVVVLPALLLAYLGEAAAVGRDHRAAAEPFYAVVPGWATIPVVVIATLATVIASEAVIAGAFTVLHQAGGLGLFPYLRTRHPSAGNPGQIYVPVVNWALMVAVLLVVLAFRSSDRLSSAYGVAVSATFLVDVTVFLTLLRIRRARWPRQVLAALCGVVIVLFLAATMPKVVSGGWVPVGLGALLFLVMSTWWSGRRRVAVARRSEETTPEDVLDKVASGEVQRVPGGAVFLTHDKTVAPIALRTLVDDGRTLPEHVVLLTWRVVDTPKAAAHRNTVKVDNLGDRFDGVVGVDVTLGYQERLDVQHVLRQACRQAPSLLEGVDPDDATYVLSEPIPRLGPNAGMARWRQHLFVLLHRLATDRVDQLALPPGRAVVIGREVELADADDVRTPE